MFKSILSISLVLLLAACASPSTTYTVAVSGIAPEQVKPGTYSLLAYPGLDKNGLQFKEFARKATITLSQNGYRRIDKVNADYAIYLNYKIGSERNDLESQILSRGGSAIYTNTTFGRVINLRCFKVQNSKLGPIVWEMDISSRGSSSDLREVFPAMLAAAEPYIGTDTGKALIQKIDEEDEALRKYTDLSRE